MIRLKGYIATLCGLLFITVGFAQVPGKQSINTGWEFYKGSIANYPATQGKDITWQQVSLPHTWNAADVSDDVPGYYRGIGWYHKTIYIPAAWKNKMLYLYFEGANQEAEIYINGKLAGTHKGGYTAFSIRIDSYVNLKDSVNANQVDIKLDNSHNESIAPLDADFSFYGGIYRDVYLITANQVHFNGDDFASSGIKINTKVDSLQAEVNISSSILNSSAQKKQLRVVNEVFAADGTSISHSQSNLSISKESNALAGQLQIIKNPHLWSPDDPYLYHVISKIYDAITGELLDETDNPLGLRWFNFSAEQGFFLNGKHLKLIGANRHQDYKDLGNAVPDALHIRDMELLKKMGGNFIRISHYPQDPAVLQACDRLGILASIEIPIVNRITETAAFTDNCKHMLVEMIRQNYNHPSLVIWAYMNEVLIYPRYDDHSEQRKLYYSRVVALAKTLDSLAHQEDWARYTMISCHGDFDRYFSTGLAKVPQIVGWNLYYGWYAKDMAGLDAFLERHHRELADKPMILTEFGADADSRLRTFNPQRFDKTVDYQLLYHQYYLKTLQKLPYVAGGAIWCLVDFSAEQRQEATPHVNTKGLLTDTREPKELYFFYQANLLKTPFIKIGTSTWKMRSGTADSQTQCVQPVNVYSNGASVSLYNNGNLIKTAPVEQGFVVFNVPFVNGINQLKATTVISEKTIEDNTVVDFKMQPADFKSTQIPFTAINVSLGSERYFIDDNLHQLWVPEQPYAKGSWGYVGGEVFKMPGNLPYGSGKNILGTEYDAIYQTQRVGLSAFKLDVPDGEYEITLQFAELITPNADKPLVYNLNDQVQKGNNTERSFDVSVNGSLLIKDLGTQNYLIPQHAYATKTTITVKDGQGITVNFNATKEQAILNGIQVNRIY
ncbi:glycoside hydrolase family 2 TIM barrel-domain containing protein [Mucilaginibacter sp.]|uniref:glycoside hydrolase family 2 TIM barrel-domain containing protein n=1 Tax=Mucilaginibacter sp. TaxID=1882438 RepID=UPI003D133DF7